MEDGSSAQTRYSVLGSGECKGSNSPSFSSDDRCSGPRFQSLVPNSTQRRVIAQEMIRAQIFRYGNSCNLLVTYHWLNSAGDSERPTLGSHRLFYQDRKST